MLSVLYEDNHLIAINKASGVLVQGDETGDVPLPELVKEYLREKYRKPGNIFAGVIHRLDRPVTGVVMLAKTSKALTRMNELFRSHDLTKIYWAIVTRRPPEDEMTLIHWLVKDKAKNITKAYENKKPDAQLAQLSFRLIGQTKGQYLLEVTPVTGRPHQIRSQLRAIGCPIVGDVKYGAPEPNADASICLHARSLTFVHPVQKEKITIAAPLPRTSRWREFEGIAR